MKRVLKYNGLTLDMMSRADLRGQLAVNRDRMIARGAILGVFGLLTVFVYPLAGLFALAVCGVTSYWLWQNQEAIRRELEARG